MVKVNWQVAAAAAAEVDLTELFRGSKSHGYRFQVQAGIFVRQDGGTGSTTSS